MANLCAVRAGMGKAGLGQAPIAGYLAFLLSAGVLGRVLELMMFLSHWEECILTRMEVPAQTGLSKIKRIS